MTVTWITRMNIAGLDDKVLHDLRRYFGASADRAANEETRSEASAYLAAIDDEIAERQAGRPSDA